MTDYDTRALERIEPNYLEHYGLNEAPFADNRDPRFTYLDAERAQRLNLLQHMTQYSNLLLMVVGERGIGKTTLMDQFIKKALDDWVICQIDANTMMDAEHLLYEAARGFGLDSLPHSSSHLQDALYRHVANLQHQDKVPLLIIDDGHLLSKEALLAVFNLADTQVEEGSLMRIILFCDPDIEKILKASDVKVVRERVTHTMTIPTFNEELTAEYLRHRMAVAGLRGESPFTPKAVHKIYKASDGVPQAINELAHMMLEQGEEPEVPTLTAPVRDQPASRPAWLKTPYIISGSLGILLVAVVLVYQDELNALFEEKPATQTAELKAALQSELQASSPPDAEVIEPPPEEKIIPLVEEPVAAAQEPTEGNDIGPLEESETAEGAVESESRPVAEPAAVTPDPGTPELVQQEEPEEKPVAMEPSREIQAPPPVIESISPSPVPASNEPQRVVIGGKHFSSQAEVTVSWPGNEKTLSDSQVDLQSAERIAISITVGTEPDEWQVRVRNPDSEQTAAASFTVKAPPQRVPPATQQDQNWVRQQPAENFTVQLFATHKRSNATAFIERHRPDEVVALFPTQKDNEIWYSVIMGSYASRDLAQGAARRLPQSLSGIQPWIRSFADIHPTVIAAPRPGATPRGTDTKERESITENEAWLWSQDPRHYTLQLLGARSVESVRQFLREHGISDKAAYFHSRHENQDWYVVVYGVYKDKQAAQQAIDRLPPTLQNTSPWIRRLGSIHADLAKTP